MTVGAILVASGEYRHSSFKAAHGKGNEAVDFVKKMVVHFNNLVYLSTSTEPRKSKFTWRSRQQRKKLRNMSEQQPVAVIIRALEKEEENTFSAGKTNVITPQTCCGLAFSDVIDDIILIQK